MFIPFGEWRPDSPALIGAARTAKNCIGEKDYYRPFQQFSPISQDLDANALGAISYKDKEGVVFTFAGDSTKLYKLTNTDFDNVSKAGDYSTLTEGVWSFSKFGTNVIATNYLNNPQVFNTATSTLFADLAGTPPRAKYSAVVGEFVVLANLVDGTFGTASNALRWSGIGDVTTWTPSAATQSDGQLLENGEGGAIQGIVGNSNYGIIIQERAIQRMNYIGSPAIFSFEVLETNRGTSLPNSIVGVGRSVFYIADDGFYQFNGVSSVNIGKDKVNQYFWDNFDTNYSNTLSTAIDPLNTVIGWSWADVYATSGFPNNILIYNWQSGKFTLIKDSVTSLFSAMSNGLTLDQLDSISTDLDALVFSLDSSVYKGGQLLFGGFNTSNQLGYFSGDNMTATIETSEFEGAKDSLTEINQITPMIDGDTNLSVSVKMGSRNNRSDAVSYSASISQDDFGRVKTRANSRYHQIEATISAGFEKATGIEVDDQFIKKGSYR